MQIHVESQGFFPWVIADGRAFACVVNVPLWLHEFRLHVPKHCVRGWSGQADEPLQSEGDMLTARLDKWQVTLKTPALQGAARPARLRRSPLGPSGVPLDGDWTGVEMVASFEDLALGSVLDANWQARSDLQGWLELSAGELFTRPDNLTRSRVFSWSGKGGRPRRQPSTENVCFACDQTPEAQLEFRHGMEPVVRYDLRGDDVPIMLTARHNLPASPLDQRRLDLAHALATMTLCDVEEGGDLTFRLALHETPLDTVTDELRHICSPVGLRQLGRPNCGPRWLFPAEAPAGEGLPPAR